PQLAPFLQAHGFQRVDRGVYDIETAFRAEWGHGPATIAICAEYDALPEIGHACGHNLIAAAGVGAAVAAIAALDPADTRIVILGTPAEEMWGGKVMMLGRARAGDQRARCAGDGLPGNRAAPPAHPPRCAAARHHHARRRRCERRAGARSGDVLHPRAAAEISRRVEAAREGLL